MDTFTGMFYHVFDKQDKIREVYFLRQLQHDEAEKKVQPCLRPRVPCRARPRSLTALMQYAVLLLCPFACRSWLIVDSQYMSWLTVGSWQGCKVRLVLLQLQHVPDIKSMGIHPEHYKGSGAAKPSEERAQKHEHYASLYNQARVHLEHSYRECRLTSYTIRARSLVQQKQAKTALAAGIGHLENDGVILHRCPDLVSCSNFLCTVQGFGMALCLSIKC